MSHALPHITITIDRDRLQEVPGDAVLVERPADYPAACRNLRNALHGITSLEICVRHRAVAQWLTEFAAGYGPERVLVRQHTPRQAFTDRWRLAVPPEVTDNDILSARLLQEKLSPQAGQSFNDVLLAHFFSRELLFTGLPVERMDALLNDYDEARWKEALRRPLIARLLHARLEQWEKAGRNESVRSIVRRLRDDPAALKRDLIAFKILRGYPPARGEKVLGKTQSVFIKARVETGALKFTEAETGDAGHEVDYYLASLKGSLSTPAEVADLVGQMSGHLNREFYFLDELLREHPDWISELLLRHVEVRFRPAESGLSHQVAALRRLVQPPFPPEPQDEWPAAHWLSWVRNDYTPYYAWLEAQDKSDETMAVYATRFADWFYAHFSTLKNSEPQTFAFSSLFRERDRISAEGAVSLILLVDNFNFVHFDEFCRLLQAQNLSLEAVEPVFSLIPTATEVGKAALVAMNGNQVDHPATDYTALVQKTWTPLLDGKPSHKKAGYLSNVGELQNLQTLQNEVLFLNFLVIDKALHEDSQQTGRPHSEVIAESLATLAKSVAEFAHRFHLEERLTVYVLSDHGSTRIGKGVVNVLDKAYYKLQAVDKHHRYLALSDEKFAQLPQMASAQCYLIDRHKFGTNKNFLAARGYYRFLDTNDTFYVHGGLTPEEVVVPFARFSFMPVEPEPLTIRLVQNEFRYAVKSNIVLEIGNPNSFPLSNVTLRLLDAESEEVLLLSFPPKTPQIMQFTTTFRKVAGSPSGLAVRHLTMRVRFDCQGRHFEPDDVTLEITLKTMMEVSDDDFDL